ncbi:MAG: polymerase sigma factor, sigma-70 family [Parcubacteria group bacterium]|jgi:RNA polymerase sigma-70 factor (ECF subfamily)|nr:polymerase sigma factor, sigma-70 family [Parcubacteria group bacterium]
MDQNEAKAYFLSIYDKHADEIFRFCFMKVSNKEKAEDLTQEAFMRYWQSLRTGEPVRNDRAFLYTLARNLVIDWYRKKKESSLDVIQEAGIDFAGEGRADVEQAAQMNEVMAVVNQLDEPSRDVILLRFVEGWSPQQIAELNHESANAVSVRLNRAIKKVQELIHATQP